MKTSSKLLIALVVCIPLAMVAYGYLLREQFDAGKFVKDVYPKIDNNVIKPLPPFNHVVMDGNLYVLEESGLTKKDDVTSDQAGDNKIISFRLNGLIEFSGSSKKRGYSVLRGYDRTVKTRVSNDTLYVSFFKLNGKPLETFGRSNILLTVFNQGLKSLNLISGDYKMTQLNGENIAVDIRNGTLHMSKLNFRKITLLANRTNPLGIDACNVDSFQYALNDQSNLTFGTNKLNAIENLGSDSLSIIAVRGYAPWMEKFLPALTHTSDKLLKNE